MGFCGSKQKVKYINPKLNMYGDKIAVKYHDGKRGTL